MDVRKENRFIKKKKEKKRKRREMKFMTLGRGGKEVSRKLLP